MVRPGCEDRFEPGFELLQNPVDILVFQRAKDQDHGFFRKILIQGLPQTPGRISVMGRINDDRRLALKDLKASGPLDLRKSPLNGFVR